MEFIKRQSTTVYHVIQRQQIQINISKLTCTSKSTSTSKIRKCIYIFDILCTLLAAALIGFGVHSIWVNETNILAQSTAASLYIAIGAATFVVFIFLKVGAIRENVCCTMTFIVLMVVIIFAQIALTLTLNINQTDVASKISTVLDSAWEDEIKSPGAMSIYETWLNCCGRASPQDYIVNERLPPETCFEGLDYSKPENLFESGCRIKFEDNWLDLLNGFNIVAWVLIALELILSFISCCLCISIRNDRRRSSYKDEMLVF